MRKAAISCNKLQFEDFHFTHNFRLEASGPIRRRLAVIAVVVVVGAKGRIGSTLSSNLKDQIAQRYNLIKPFALR